MKEYHKINTVWKRDTRGQIILGEYSDPIFDYLKDNLWVFTEKVDGTNIRIHWDGQRVKFGGRTDATMIHNGLVDYLRQTFTDDKLLAKFGESEVCLYGEGYGAKIQAGGGNYKADGQAFVLFDVLVGPWWLKREDVEDVAANLGIGVVPVIFEGTLADAQDRVIGGLVSSWGAFQAEGVVGKPKVEMFSRNGDRIVVKMKTKDYAKIPASR